eukprot:5957577-Alexandrium_andersonii.AAC.1
MRIKDASPRARVVGAQKALEKQGFNPKGIGSEAQKGSRAQRVAPSMSSTRAAAVSCFPSGGAAAASGASRDQFEQAGCIGSTRLGGRGAMPWMPKQGKGVQGRGAASDRDASSGSAGRAKGE